MIDNIVMKLNRLTKNLEVAINKQNFKCRSGQVRKRADGTR
jgi:hypothetical protein